jgi:hypothetical protein
MVLVLMFLVTLMSAIPLSGQESLRHSNRDFWLLSATAAGMVIADIEVTKYKQQTMPGIREMNSLLGPYPSRARMYAMGLGAEVGLNLLAWRLKKQGHRRLWKAVFVASIAVNAWCIQHNLRLREHRAWQGVPR